MRNQAAFFMSKNVAFSQFAQDCRPERHPNESDKTIHGTPYAISTLQRDVIPYAAILLDLAVAK